MIQLSYESLEAIEKMKNVKGLLVSKWVKTYMTAEIQQVLDENNLTMPQLSWIVKHGLTEIPVCPTCGKEVDYVKGRVYCSTKCAGNNKELQERIKKTTKERFGVECILASKEFRKQMKQNNLKKYGTEWPMSTQEFKDRVKQTNLEKYGHVCSVHGQEIHEKVVKTNMERYGVDNPWKSKEVRKKMAQTNMERYGAEIYTNSDDFKNKSKSTCLEKFGAESSFGNKEFHKRCMRTFRKGYYEEFLRKLHERKYECLSTYDEYVEFAEPLKYKCLRCGYEFEKMKSAPAAIFCPNCATISSSHIEEELYEFICDLIGRKNVEEHNRSVLGRKELDVYVPEMKIAFEMNGDYWHSEKKNGIDSHLYKTKLCESQGIQLVHIFEHEWKCKNEICRYLIEEALGIYDEISADDCEVIEIDSESYSDFLEKNCIYGHFAVDKMLGLSYNSTIIAVAGWIVDDKVELKRFCSLNGFRVIGGLEKLALTSGFEEFDFYLDRAKFSRDFIESEYFTIEEAIEPSFHLTNGKKVIGYDFCSKENIRKIVGDGWKSELSMEENLNVNGFSRVFNCGFWKVKFYNSSVRGGNETSA